MNTFIIPQELLNNIEVAEQNYENALAVHAANIDTARERLLSLMATHIDNKKILTDNYQMLSDSNNFKIQTDGRSITFNCGTYFGSTFDVTNFNFSFSSAFTDDKLEFINEVSGSSFRFGGTNTAYVKFQLIGFLMTAFATNEEFTTAWNNIITELNISYKEMKKVERIFSRLIQEKNNLEKAENDRLAEIKKVEFFANLAVGQTYVVSTRYNHVITVEKITNASVEVGKNYRDDVRKFRYSKEDFYNEFIKNNL